MDFRALDREARIGEVKSFARLLIRVITDELPPASVPAAARAVVEAGEEGVPLAEIPGRGDGGSDVEEALRTLELRRLVVFGGGRYRAAPGAGDLLRYYAGSDPVS